MLSYLLTFFLFPVLKKNHNVENTTLQQLLQDAGIPILLANAEQAKPFNLRINIKPAVLVTPRSIKQVSSTQHSAFYPALTRII
jgi:hypothetical protein